MANTETKKTGARFNIFDVIIILAILACIAALAVRAYFSSNIEESFTDASIAFSVVGISENTAASLKVGDAIFLSDSGREIGIITEATYDAALLQVENAEGQLVTARHPDKKDLHGAATLKGIWTDDAFMIAGVLPATAGKTVNIYTKTVTFTITITSISAKP